RNANRLSNVTVGTTQRSIAAIASAWLRRNVRQVCDGGPRCRIMYLETVDSAISNPSLSNSPTRLVSVTNKGRAAVSASFDAWRRAQAAVAAAIGPSGVGALRALSRTQLG